MLSPRPITQNPRVLRATFGLFLAATAAPVPGCVGGTGDPDSERTGTTTSALGVSGLSGWSQIPGGLFNSGPAATGRDIFQNPDTIEVCGLGLDNRIWCARWSSHLGWNPFSPLGSNTFTDRPGITAWKDTAQRAQVAVVANTSSGAVMINTTKVNIIGEFTGWATIPGSGPFTRPAMIAFQGGKFHVFGIKADQRMYFASNDVSSGVFDNANWSAWREVPGGGLFNSAPSVTTLLEDGRLALAGRGLDNRFWVTAANAPGLVDGWHQIASAEQTIAPCISSRDFTVDLFGAFATSNRVVVTTVNPDFSPPQPPGFESFPDGVVDTPVSVALRNSNKLDIVGRGLDKAFWINHWNE